MEDDEIGTTVEVHGTEQDVREALVRELIQGGWPERHAREAVDIAAHATDEAMRAFERILQTASNGGVLMQATSVGGQLLRDRAEYVFKQTYAIAGALNQASDPEEMVAIMQRLME
jgi:hypothetical protein